MAAFQGPLLERHVHCQFPGVEFRQCRSEPLEKRLGITSQTEMPPGHPTRYDVPGDTSHGKGHREIQYGGFESLPGEHGPDGFTRDVPGIHHPKLAFSRTALEAQKIKNPVISWTPARHQGRPRRRRQRRDYGLKLRPRTGSYEGFEV